MTANSTAGKRLIITNEIWDSFLFLDFSFAMARHINSPEFYFAFAFVMNMQATTAGRPYENMHSPKDIILLSLS